MRIGNKETTRAEVLQRIGNTRQLGGMRHIILNEGRGKGVAAVDVDTGSGLRFTILPDRCLDISTASYKGTNLVFLNPNGEVHPAFYEPQESGWLRIFIGGLLTTCGLTYLGLPGRDGEESLGLHGRAATTPAKQVCDRSGWQGDDYRLEISGVIEEAVLFGDKIRLTRIITTYLGSKSLVIHDVAENFGYRTSPFTILYHINPGFPLLDACSTLSLTARKTQAYNERSARGLGETLRFNAPAAGYEDQDFLHAMQADGEGRAWAAFVNRELCGGRLGLTLRFDVSTLPYLSEWKMLGQGDYVVGMEPCNAPCENRAVLRERGLLPHLEPGETREMRLEIGVLEGEDEITACEERIAAIVKGA